MNAQPYDLIGDKVTPLEDPFSTLWARLRDKSKKSHAAPTCLLVYLDISIFDFKNWKIPIHEQMLAEHSRVNFDGVSAFRRVLVLSNDMNNLTELSPSSRTILH